MKPSKKRKQVDIKRAKQRANRAFERCYKNGGYQYGLDAMTQARAWFVNGFVTAVRLARKPQ